MYFFNEVETLMDKVMYKLHIYNKKHCEILYNDYNHILIHILYWKKVNLSLLFLLLADTNKDTVCHQTMLFMTLYCEAKGKQRIG